MTKTNEELEADINHIKETQNDVFDKFVERFGSMISRLEGILFTNSGSKGFIERTEDRIEKLENRINYYDKILVFSKILADKDWKFIAGLILGISTLGWLFIKTILWMFFSFKEYFIK
jgi:hypothetical protein